jgi:hypothetical protein
MVDRLYPLVPATLPDGRVVWEERGKARAVIDAIRAYDPRYSLVRDFEANTWEVWRQNEQGNPSRSMVVHGDRLPEPNEVLDHLHKHDLWKGYDPIADQAAHEAAMERQVDAELEEIALRNADQIHRELVDEFSAHMPAARPMYLGNTARRRRSR